MGSNTQAKSKEVTVLLTNFIFISLISFYLIFLVLAFFDSSSLRTHFRPFTRVLRRIWPFVTQKMLRDVKALNG
ncbi:MAG: hypothetical protein DME55_09335 [Verrucomicrobia bacterium]|nr:MAG: hypothetical protein DME55_09335 [Verrucomicrobiota bacterium]